MVTTLSIHAFVNNTYVQSQIIIDYFEEKNLINPSPKVFKRKVTFAETTDDAIAKICLVHKSTDGNFIYLINDEVWNYSN